MTSIQTPSTSTQNSMSSSQENCNKHQNGQLLMNTLRPIDDDDWEAMMEVNFLAILFMYLIAHCVETEKGQVGKLYISGYILMET